MLEGELIAYLDYDKHDLRKDQNARNGYTTKIIKSDLGEDVIKVPRDRDATFNPKIVDIQTHEFEYSSGGRMGEENIKNVVSDLKQIGDSKITYVNKSNLNLKNIVSEEKDDGMFSNTRNVTYDLVKPYGQSNRVTAEYYSNKSNNSGQKATALESAVKIIWAILKK